MNQQSFVPLKAPRSPEVGSVRLQRKLSIGTSNDPLEQEADRVADQVLAAPAHPAVSGAPPRIQRFSGQPTGRGYGARQRRPRPRRLWQAAGTGATAGHGAALRPRLFAGAGAFRRGCRAIGAGGERPCLHGRTRHCVRCGSVRAGDARGTAVDCPRADACGAAVRDKGRYPFVPRDAAGRSAAGHRPRAGPSEPPARPRPPASGRRADGRPRQDRVLAGRRRLQDTWRCHPWPYGGADAPDGLGYLEARRRREDERRAAGVVRSPAPVGGRQSGYRPGFCTNSLGVGVARRRYGRARQDRQGQSTAGHEPENGHDMEGWRQTGTWGEAVRFRSAGQVFEKVGRGINSGFDPTAVPGGGVRDPSFPATGSKDMPMRVQPGPLEQRIDPTAGGSIIKSGGVRRNVPTGRS